MTVEIISVEIRDGTVTIDAVDVSEENLQRLERVRDEGTERTLSYAFDTRDPAAFRYLRNFLKRQKSTRGALTWGEALTSLIGTRIQSPRGLYRADF